MYNKLVAVQIKEKFAELTIYESIKCENVKELTEALYTEFAEDYEVKDIITDLIYLSDSFKSLSEKDFKTAINENIETINAFKIKEAKSHFRSQYKEVNDVNEMEKLGIDSVPMLKVNNKLLSFIEAVKYTNEAR